MWCLCRILIAGLFGSVWGSEGDEIPLMEERAKHLASKKGGQVVEIVGPPEPLPMPDMSAVTLSPGDFEDYDPEGEGGGKKAGDQGTGSSDSIPEGETSLADAGVTGTASKLLEENGYRTKEAVLKAHDEGFDFTSINGIGQKTMDSVLAVLNSDDEDD